MVPGYKNLVLVRLCREPFSEITNFIPAIAACHEIAREHKYVAIRNGYFPMVTVRIRQRYYLYLLLHFFSRYLITTSEYDSASWNSTSSAYSQGLVSPCSLAPTE